MEKLVRVISQGALQQRNWTSPKGENVVISSVELVLTDGIDTFVGEVTDQKAIAINNEPLSKEHLYGVQMKLTAREWKSEQTQQLVRATSVKILNIAKI
jgi:hypothetical protein